MEGTGINIFMEKEKDCAVDVGRLNSSEEVGDASSTRGKSKTLIWEKTRKKRKCQVKTPGSAAVDKQAVAGLAELPFRNTDIQAEFSIEIQTSRKTRKEKHGKSNAATNKQKARPNYFVAIPIRDPKVVADMQMVQEDVLAKDKHLARAIIPACMLHITVLVAHLFSEPEVQSAIEAMNLCRERLKPLLCESPFVLPFQGLGQFKHQVVFVKVAEGSHLERLSKIAGVVEQCFQERGVYSADQKGFTPHLTIMKLSRDQKLRKKGVRRIDPALYEKYEMHDFGQEQLRCLDLCAMLKKKQPSGYFHCEASVQFGFDTMGSSRGETMTTLKEDEESQDVQVKFDGAIGDNQENNCMRKLFQIAEPSLLHAVENPKSASNVGVGKAEMKIMAISNRSNINDNAAVCEVDDHQKGVEAAAEVEVTEAQIHDDEINFADTVHLEEDSERHFAGIKMCFEDHKSEKEDVEDDQVKEWHERSRDESKVRRDVALLDVKNVTVGGLTEAELQATSFEIVAHILKMAIKQILQEMASASDASAFITKGMP
uniref:uncharacterized protein isoform X2 n=1 Tax=Myxine glutinosa TaxID=7769 RepID=UPI00358E6D42